MIYDINDTSLNNVTNTQEIDISIDYASIPDVTSEWIYCYEMHNRELLFQSFKHN